MAATPSNSAVPSIFITAPRGNTILLVLCDTLSSCSATCIESGNVAELDEVANAIAIGAEMALKSLLMLMPVTNLAMLGNTIAPCTTVKAKTNSANRANCLNSELLPVTVNSNTIEKTASGAKRTIADTKVLTPLFSPARTSNKGCFSGSADSKAIPNKNENNTMANKLP